MKKMLWCLVGVLCLGGIVSSAEAGTAAVCSPAVFYTPPHYKPASYSLRDVPRQAVLEHKYKRSTRTKVCRPGYTAQGDQCVGCPPGTEKVGKYAGCFKLCGPEYKTDGTMCRMFCNKPGYTAHKGGGNPKCVTKCTSSHLLDSNANFCYVACRAKYVHVATYGTGVPRCVKPICPKGSEYRKYTGECCRGVRVR